MKRQKQHGKKHEFIMTIEQKEAIKRATNRDEIEWWKRLKYYGIETKYFISSKGNVKSRKESNKSWKFLKQYIDDGKGYRYPSVTIYVNTKPIQVSVHRLVAMNFIEVPDVYIKSGYTMHTLQVNHKDAITYDNYVDNLEWCTMAENLEHAAKSNLLPSCEDNHNAKLKNEDVHRICKELESDNFIINDIAKKYGVSSDIITKIKMGETYTKISSMYNIKHESRTPAIHLDNDTIHKICSDLEESLPISEIAKKHNLPRFVIDQIRWGKRSSNISSKYNIDVAFRQVHADKLNDDIVHEICKDLEKGTSSRILTKKYGIRKHVLRNIRKRKSYVRISKNYNF